MPAASTQAPTKAPSRRAWWALGLYWPVMFLATHWPAISRYRLPHLPLRGMIAHVGLYLIWAAFWWRALSGRGQGAGRRAALAILLGGLGYAVVDEATQALVHRSPRPDDLAADIVGLLAGLALAVALQRRAARRALHP